ncbi:MAG: caspase family protein, partial [Alphaproteobacteria bacterium]
MIARPRNAAFPTTRPWRRTLAGTVLAATLLAALPFGADAADSGKRVALVIDNGRYNGLESRSDQAAANAGAMASALRKAGFAVTRADNVGRVAMESALERFREALSGADLGFVYYTGLAVGLGEREYLLPADAAPAGAEDLPRTALDLDTVLGDLRDSGRKSVVVIDPGTADALAQRVGGGALGTPMEADGLFVVYAHRPGVPPVPPQAAKGPAPFTAALAREMVKPGVTFRDSL